MYIKTLNISNYKNISEARLSFSPKINCFIGSNGAGKTNLLDALCYLSFCRSATGQPDATIAKHGTGYFMLDAIYGNDNGEEESIYCGMKTGVRKRFRRNGKDYKKLSEHIGLIPLISVSPSDTSLIDGASEERRKLMDVVIAQYVSDYIDNINAYTKALQQRNALLKAEDEPDMALMELLEEQMAYYGELIYNRRSAFVEQLTPIFKDFYCKISGGKEDVSINYKSHCQRGALIDTIRKDRHKDRAVGYSLHGVHRDDLEMLADGYPVRREGSQGQNKSFVISLKLSQFDFLKRTSTGTTPLLLLDDIFDKLDADRVEQIVRLVSSDSFGQIMLTDTNRKHIDEILQRSVTEYKIFKVEEGNIIQDSNNHTL